MTKAAWGHNALANDLAGHLRASGERLVWTDMQLGPAGSPRPDVYTMPKTYSKFTPLAYECKISMADFRRDVTAGKWQSYLQFAAGVIFAAPAGLITKADVPPGCGLILRHENAWRMAKGPTLKHIESLPHEAWMKLMIDGIPRAVFDRRVEDRPFNRLKVNTEIGRKYGQKIAALLSDLGNAEDRMTVETARINAQVDSLEEMRRKQAADMRASVEREMSIIRQERTDLCEVLGLPPDAPIWKMSQAFHEAAKRLTVDGEIQNLQRALGKVRDALEQGLTPLPALARSGDGQVA